MLKLRLPRRAMKPTRRADKGSVKVRIAARDKSGNRARRKTLKIKLR